MVYYNFTGGADRARLCLDLVDTSAFCLVAGFLLTALSRRVSGNKSTMTIWMVVGILAIIVSSAVTPNVKVGTSLVFGLPLLVLIAVDVAVMRLPDFITLPLAAIGLTSLNDGPTVGSERLVGLLIGTYGTLALNGVYKRLRGRDGIGGGDAKLLGVAGAWLGCSNLPVTILLASVSGLGWIALRSSKLDQAMLTRKVPFAPPLCITIYCLWLVQHRTGAGVSELLGHET